MNFFPDFASANSDIQLFTALASTDPDKSKVSDRSTLWGRIALKMNNLMPCHQCSSGMCHSNDACTDHDDLHMLILLWDSEQRVSIGQRFKKWGFSRLRKLLAGSTIAP